MLDSDKSHRLLCNTYRSVVPHGWQKLENKKLLSHPAFGLGFLLDEIS